MMKKIKKMTKPENEGGFVSHLTELRKRLINSFIFLFIIFIICYFFSEYIYGFLVEPFSKAVKEISEGELFQIQKSRNFNLSEEDYIILISKKTASLFSCCCKLGSISSGKNNIDDIELFGNYLGIIFQIKDDLFDFTTKRIGKPNKSDLKSQKITLPLIHSIQNSSYRDRREIKAILKKKKYTTDNKKLVNEFIIKYNGFDYTHNKMLNYKNKAIEILEKFPNNESRDSIKTLLDYIIERKY
jgi:octaprenyl-diphosphate synthase